MLITSWKCGAPRRTTGRPLAKLPAKPLENRRKTTGKTVGKTAGKPPEDHWQKLSAKPPGNRRGKPRFWVTFASLNKGLEWLERVSPASFFGPWGGGCHKESTFQA